MLQIQPYIGNDFGHSPSTVCSLSCTPSPCSPPSPCLFLPLPLPPRGTLEAHWCVRECSPAWCPGDGAALSPTPPACTSRCTSSSPGSKPHWMPTPELAKQIEYNAPLLLHLVPLLQSLPCFFHPT